jgi:hypothetical protein
MRTRTIAAAGLVALTLVGVGCGAKSSSTTRTTSSTAAKPAAEASPAGDIPDNQAYVAYKPAGAGFSVKVPEGWAQSGSGSNTTFTDKLNSISVRAVPAKGQMTVAEAKRVAGATVDTVHRSAGTAVRIKYLTSSKPDPVTGKVVKDAVERYVFFHNGRRLVLTLSGPKGADNVDPWKLVTDSVRWTR